MREWVISWVVFRQADEDGRQADGNAWLRRDVRQKAEGFLHAVRSIAGDAELRGTLTDEQRALGGFWNDLAEVRNAYAHHGMRGDDLVRDGTIAAARARVLTCWKESTRPGFACSMSIGEAPGGRVLISPIGKRPGVLFSAVHAARESGAGGEPTLCLVICSRDTEGLIAEAVEQAQFAGVYQPLVLADAFSGGPRRDRAVGHGSSQALHRRDRCAGERYRRNDAHGLGRGGTRVRSPFTRLPGSSLRPDRPPSGEGAGQGPASTRRAVLARRRRG